ncbi:MAG: hypothetical protein K5989_01660 [Lachnospiraceae bacterium]|nr:hypothetical protein [Lachnospiraceae bacterium]
MGNVREGSGNSYMTEVLEVRKWYRNWKSLYDESFELRKWYRTRKSLYDGGFGSL